MIGIVGAAWFTCVRVSPLVSGMTHQDQMEVMRQTKEKVKRVGEMPNARHMFGITLVAKIECKKKTNQVAGTIFWHQM